MTIVVYPEYCVAFTESYLIVLEHKLKQRVNFIVIEEDDVTRPTTPNNLQMEPDSKWKATTFSVSSFLSFSDSSSECSDSENDTDSEDS